MESYQNRDKSNNYIIEKHSLIIIDPTMSKKNTFDLSKHLPRHPFVKGLMGLLAIVGLTGLL